MRSFSGQQAKQVAAVQEALDSLRQGRDGYEPGISTDPRYLELVNRFNGLTGTTVGRYCRELGEGEDVPESILEILRELIWIANGRNAAYASPATDR